MKRSGLQELLLYALTLTLTLACGAPEGADNDRQEDALVEQSHNEKTMAHSDLQVPPQEYYDALFQRSLKNADSYSLAGTTQVLYLDFDGASINRGYDDGESFILCTGSAEIASPGLTNTQQDQIVDQVAAYYHKVDVAIEVTKDKPQGADFTTIIVGGSYRDLGCFGGGVLGVAPFDAGNANKRDVGFAFTDGVNSIKTIADTIAHEAGHSFGLNHIENNKALMYFSMQPLIEGFSSGRVRGTNRTQDSVALLQNNLGKLVGGSNPPANDDAPADDDQLADDGDDDGVNPPPAPMPIPNLPPIPNGGNGGGIAGIPGLDQLGDLSDLLDLLGGFGGIAGGGGLPGGLDLDQLFPGGLGGVGGLGGLDQILAGIGLGNILGGAGGAGGLPDLSQILGGLDLDAILAGGGLDQILAGGLPGGFDISDILAGGLPGGFDISDILAGGGLDQILGGGLPGGFDISDILAGGGSGGLPGGLDLDAILAGGGINGLPDFSQILGIAGGGNSPFDLSDLINSFNLSAAYVNANYTGDQRQALMSALKVGYAQEFQKRSEEE